MTHIDVPGSLIKVHAGHSTSPPRPSSSSFFFSFALSDRADGASSGSAGLIFSSSVPQSYSSGKSPREEGFSWLFKLPSGLGSDNGKNGLSTALTLGSF